MQGSDLKIGKTVVVDFLHFTGGLRAGKGARGWNIGPILRDDQPGHIGPVPDHEVARCCASLGVRLFGGDRVSDADSALPTHIWTPILGPPPVHQAADTWGMIEQGARAAGDHAYAALAQNVSVSLRAAGIRLRDASDQYHLQLIASLERRRQLGRFQNVAIQDLHLAFHSLLSELGSARDYLAAIAGRQVGAPEKVDALSRLVTWLQKGANQAHSSGPFIAAMLEASDQGKPDPWLMELSKYRNLFLHNEPLGTNEHARWLSLIERETPQSKVRLIDMQVPVRPGMPETCEALHRFVDLHARMCRLADFAAKQASYPPCIPDVKFG
jgi:hypothetical protein